MLNDARRAVDDLAAICKAIVKPGEPIHSVSGGTASYIANDAATKVMCALVPAATRGVDVGAALHEVLATWARRNGVDVSEPEPEALSPEARKDRVRDMAAALLQMARAYGITVSCTTGNDPAMDFVGVHHVPFWRPEPERAAEAERVLRPLATGATA